MLIMLCMQNHRYYNVSIKYIVFIGDLAEFSQISMNSDIIGDGHRNNSDPIGLILPSRKYKAS